MGLEEKDQPKSRLKTPIQRKDLKDEGGVEFEVDVADFEEEGSDERFRDYFNEEEGLDQFYFGLPTDIAASRLDDFSKVPHRELELKMKCISANRGVFKNEVKAGYGVIVTQKALVTVHYNCFLEKTSEPFDSSKLRNTPMKFVLGDNRVIAGLDVAVSSMCRGEISEFLIKPSYAYGEMGCPPRIPANASIFYTVELIAFIEAAAAVEFSEETAEDQKKAPFEKTLKVCKTMHLAGNEMFKEKQYKAAVGQYRRAVNLLTKQNYADEVEENDANKLLSKLYVNSAMGNVQIGEAQHAVYNCKRALEINPTNVKALYYCGKAFRMLSDYQPARDYLRQAAKLAPTDQMIKIEIEELNKRQKMDRNKEEEFCKRMFGGNSTEAPVTTTQDEPKNVDVNSSEFDYLREKILQFQLNPDMTELPFSNMFNAVEIGFVKLFSEEIGLKCIEPKQQHLRLKIVKDA